MEIVQLVQSQSVAGAVASDERMLTRLRSLCDAHLRLFVENVSGKQVRTMEVSKVHKADLATGNLVSFNVGPKLGMYILPMSKAKALLRAEVEGLGCW